MEAFAANEVELRWLNSQGSASTAAPADGARPELRAEFLRRLVLNLPVAGADRDAQAMVARFGLRVTGARIAGRLDLVDGTSAAGGALPPLVLEDCDIPDEIDLSSAHLARLSVKGSRITHLAARGLRLDGNLDFSWVYGIDPPPGDQDDAMDWIARQGIWLDERRPLAWIDASGARIDGDVFGRGATLCAPGKREQVSAGTQRYALRLLNCTVGGQVDLLDGFAAIGGVNFSDADIRGEVWLRGAAVRAGEGSAFSAQSARLGSVVGLDGGFEAEGQVWLFGARITGTLACNDATFSNPGGNALTLEDAEIGGSALLGGEKFKATGEVSLLGARITGNLACDAATFSNPGGAALTLAGAEIGGDLRLNETVVLGELTLWGAHVTRDLGARGAHLLSRDVAVWAESLQVDGSIRLIRAEVVGTVHCPNLEVRGGLDWSGMQIKEEVTRDRETFRSWTPLLNFRNAHFGLRLTGKDLLTDPGLSLLTIDLGDARVSTLDDDWPGGWGGAAARAGRVRINLDGFLYDRFHECPSERIDARFREWLVQLIERAENRLTALDETPRGVGRPSRHWDGVLHRCCTMLRALLDWLRAWLRLDKLDRHSARNRIEWLRAPGAAFYPQPYRHLARVLRAHGHAEAAREVGIAEGWAMPAGFWYRRLGLRWLFGWLFGFGLAPARAAVTLLVFLVILSIGIAAARNSKALVLTTTPVVSVLTQTEDVPHAVVENRKDRPRQFALAEPPCRDEIVPVFYAADMMIPAIPLHQETKCEVSLRPDLWWLRWAKEILSMLGKIVTTLALITFSGVLNVRPQE